jgi:hypothetical protein
MAAEPVARSQTPDQGTGVWVFSCDGQVVRIKAGTDGVAETTSLVNVITKRTSGRFDGCLVEDVKSGLRTPTIVVVVPHENFVNAGGKRHYSVLGLNRSSLALVNRFDIAPLQEGSPKVAMSTKGSLLKIVYEAESRSQRGALVSKDLDVASFNQRANRQNIVSETLSSSEKFFFLEDGVVHANGEINSDGNTLDLTGPLAVLEYSKRALGRDALTQVPIGPVDSVFGVTLYVDGLDTRAKPVKSSRLIAFDTIERQVINRFETPFALASTVSRNMPNVHLTPDGRVAIVEEYIWPEPVGSPSRIMVKTGLLAAYELRSGTLLGKVTIPAVSGFGYVVDFSNDSRNLFYVDSGKFYIIDATTMLVVSATALPNWFSPIAAVTTQ